MQAYSSSRSHPKLSCAPIIPLPDMRPVAIAPLTTLPTAVVCTTLLSILLSLLHRCIILNAASLLVHITPPGAATPPGALPDATSLSGLQRRSLTIGCHVDVLDVSPGPNSSERDWQCQRWVWYYQSCRTEFFRYKSSFNPMCIYLTSPSNFRPSLLPSRSSIIMHRW